MKLKYLIPSLRCACTEALTHHAHSTLTEKSALAVGFDVNFDPHILFVMDQNASNCPPYIKYGIVFLTNVCSITDTIAGLGLSHEQSVSRMAHSVLSLLHSRLYEIHPKQDDHIIELAGMLANYAVIGIQTCIANEAQSEPKPALSIGNHPERN